MAGADAEPSGEEGELRRWMAWLTGLIERLPELAPNGRALGFIEAVADEWGASIAEAAAGTAPQAPRPASMLLLKVARILVQHTVNASLAHGHIDEMSRAGIQQSFSNAVGGILADGEAWLETAMPSPEDFAGEVGAVKQGITQGQAALQQRQDEDRADDVAAQQNPYGAILGYHDPSVDASIVFTQVCSLTKGELDRYADAYNRLKQMIDSELLSYVADMSDALLAVLEETLRDINDRRFSLGNIDAVDQTLQRIRNAAIAFTSALHSHQTQTYWQAEQQFGKDSEQYRRLQKLFHGIYDASDGYMLLYELRHVLLHISIGAVYSNLAARVEGESAVELNISRYWMSRSSGLMDKKYKRERFEALSTDPSVLDLIADVQPRFGPLQEEIDKILYPDVAVDTATVRELIQRFNGRKGMYALQLGPGFTRRLWVPPHTPLAPRVLSFADNYGEEAI